MRTVPRLLSFVLLCVLLPALAGASDEEREKLYFGIEIGGVLCGYSETTVAVAAEEGLVRVDQHLFIMVSALGSKFNSDVRLVYDVDPKTGRFVFHESVVEQGRMRLSLTIRVEGNKAHCVSSLEEEETVVELGEDVVLENPYFYPHLVRDFLDEEAQEKEYEIFEVREQEVQTSTYTRKRKEKLELAGETFEALVLERRTQATGVRMTMWLDTVSGRVIQVDVPPDRKAYLADASVVKRIEIANLDASITARTNVSIADVRGITYMKVKAVLEPTGLEVKPEGLSVPGQTFKGNVEGNRIEGVFEVEHPHYDGDGAPPFPPPDDGSDELAAYLEAEGLVQADDPVLVKQARELTKGAADCWEASRRLAVWVSDNIDYAIPGGVTARKTYDTRTGECGSHSILFAAFCRAVGIPARVVWGCMYVPSQGGAFGQHAWNEVHMGDAGWVPVDTTAMETDFVDSGHIRIAELSSVTIAVNLRAMEVLDHRVGAGKATDDASASVVAYEPYVGEYAHVGGGPGAKTYVQDGALVVEIPGRVTLALNDADASGAWYAKLSNRVYCTFEKDDAGTVTEVHIHETVRMQRTGAPEAVADDVPEAYRAYLGSYLMAPLKATFEVVYEEGRLAVKDPLAKKTIGLQAPDDQGRFLDEFGKNTIAFEREADGAVRALVVDAVSRFRR